MGSQFEDKVVILVGAATGQGQVAARMFAEEGATIVLADVDKEVESVFAEVSGQTGCKGFASVTNISDEGEVDALVAKAIEEFGRVDVAVPFAGVVQDAASASELTMSEWDRVMGVNLKGPWLLSKAVSPHMQKQKSGRIVLIGSFWGRKGFAYFSAYCASKAGVISLAQTLSEEMAPFGVTVNSVSPGMIQTGMHKKALTDEAKERGITYEEFRDSEWAKIPLGAAGMPEDIVNAVMFLASDKAAYINGASLDVNGGILMH